MGTGGEGQRVNNIVGWKFLSIWSYGHYYISTGLFCLTPRVPHGDIHIL